MDIVFKLASELFWLYSVCSIALCGFGLVHFSNRAVKPGESLTASRARLALFFVVGAGRLVDISGQRVMFYIAGVP